ncbi:MAG TPA: acyl-ACP--UDP-N-acetylglucosamine O-acyltransferase [Campylobacteraceae bacterium]|nr:acyl-ACP--UDP-N-acetylglucosamine O-acyltransferase [Campylobacteraceae bacterium]HHD83736.1 acyl-ACP--UDP-N-acetylglucosamine O-acyltransferase [Campylobacteraceae bacterium]
MQNIHPTAIVEEGAQISPKAVVGPYTFVSAKAVLADGVVIAQGAQIHGHTEIGENTKIFQNAAIGSIPQDLKFRGGDVKLIIGKNNTIREFTFFNPGTEDDRGETVIGDNNLFMAYTHVAHDCVIGDNNILANNAALAGHVVVGNHVVIGGHTPIHQFVHIGDHAMIGGASAVTQDIPPFCLAEGNRATVRSLNIVGLRRRFEREDVDALSSAFKKIFRGRGTIKESAEALLKQTENAKVKQLCEFIVHTKRGIPYERK